MFMQRFDFEGMLKAVERYGITYMPVSPPLVVALAKSELVKKYDLSSLRYLGCGGAPLGKEVADDFRGKFPNVEIGQVNELLYFFFNFFCFLPILDREFSFFCFLPIFYWEFSLCFLPRARIDILTLGQGLW